MRFRKSAFSAYLPGVIGSDEFLRAYASAIEGAKPEKLAIGIDRTRPGTLNSLIVRYYASPLFSGLRATTQATYRGIIERFRSEFGEGYLRDFRRDHFEAVLGAMADRPSAANNLRRVLCMLFDYALDCQMVDANPLARLKPFAIKSDGFVTWSEADIEQFEKRHSVGTKPRLALELLLNTAQRRGDVVRMGRQHVRAGRIAVVQEKTGVSLQIPILPRLREALDAMPTSNLTFLTTSAGASYTAAGFGNWFREQCDLAGLSGLSAHGLRKAAARRLAEAGLSSKAIASITGHGTLKEIERYTRAADQVKLADAAMAALAAGTKTEQVLSNLPGEVGQTRA